jgi:hypothetical protein
MIDFESRGGASTQTKISNRLVWTNPFKDESDPGVKAGFFAKVGRTRSAALCAKADTEKPLRSSASNSPNSA